MGKNVMKHARFLLVIVMLLFSGLFLPIVSGSSFKIKNSVDNLGKKVDGYRFIQDVRVRDEVYDALESNSLIFREYRDAKERQLQLVVVYHQNDRWGAHDPTVCYKSQGWEVIEKTNVTKIKADGRIFPVNRFVVKKDGNLNLVYYYWFSTTGITHSRNQQMFDMILHGLIHGYTESGFVRFSIPISRIMDEDTINQLNYFVDKFTQVLEKGYFVH